MDKIITVDFRDDTLFAVEKDDGVFVAIKPIVQTIGLDWKAQLRRVTDDAILSKGMVVATIPSPGGAQITTCLRLDLVNGWLFTLEDSRVKDPVVRERVLTYKRECYSVLFNHFYKRPNVEAEPVQRIVPQEATITPKPYDQWTLEEVRTHLSVANCYRHTLNNASGAWYLMREGFPRPPERLMPGWWQSDLNLREQKEGRAIVTVSLPTSDRGH